MARSYDDAAEAARDSEVLDPDDVTRQEVQRRMEDFLSVEDPNSPDARKLIDEATDRAMDQEVGYLAAGDRDHGGSLGERSNIKTTWEHPDGYIMAENENGTRRKIAELDE